MDRYLVNLTLNGAFVRSLNKESKRKSLRIINARIIDKN